MHGLQLLARGNSWGVPNTGTPDFIIQLSSAPSISTAILHMHAICPKGTQEFITPHG
jgi:hypothetical protein